MKTNSSFRRVKKKNRRTFHQRTRPAGSTAADTPLIKEPAQQLAQGAGQDDAFPMGILCAGPRRGQNSEGANRLSDRGPDGRVPGRRLLRSLPRFQGDGSRHTSSS